MDVPKIKICGLTTAEEAGWIVEEQVDYAGIVLFYPKSKRNMTIPESEKLLAVIHGGRAQSGAPIQAVAVTVSPTREQVEQIQAAGFDKIQVHGELQKEVFDAIRIPVIRAFNGMDDELYRRCHDCRKVEAYLFDAGQPGSGKTFDWDSLKAVPRDEKPVFLAGGLNVSNVRQAIRAVLPDVVDVSSGVERDVADISGVIGMNEVQRAPARVGKDREKIREFVRKVRNGGEDE